ncbi:hypothetical protein AAH524_003465 [Salmonella enterica]|nr:hypothetical protein [Salmonella enterica]EEW9935502.1 hypothetical protein [Salmonella enterica]EFT4013305.1 hypothetical protein [Salmonella enterica]EGM4607969.1 hypothetical protein [Salmonella enterica]EKJ9484315.1 hypothetical protein [Salmonella enterica]
MGRYFITLCAILSLLTPLYSRAEFTVAMYNEMKGLTYSSNAESAKQAKDMIATYLMGVASGVNTISQFEKAKNGTKIPYCLPKGTKLTPSFAEYVVDSVLSDKDAKFDNVDGMGISTIYTIGLLRYYKCP